MLLREALRQRELREPQEARAFLFHKFRSSGSGVEVRIRLRAGRFTDHCYMNQVKKPNFTLLENTLEEFKKELRIEENDEAFHQAQMRMLSTMEEKMGRTRHSKTKELESSARKLLPRGEFATLRANRDRHDRVMETIFKKRHRHYPFYGDSLLQFYTEYRDRRTILLETVSGIRELDPDGKDIDRLPKEMQARYLRGCALYEEVVVHNRKRPEEPPWHHFESRDELVARIKDKTARFRSEPDVFTPELICEAIRDDYTVYSLCKPEMRNNPTVRSAFLRSRSAFRGGRAWRKVRDAVRVRPYALRWLEHVAERKYHPKTNDVQESHRSEAEAMSHLQPGASAD